ncbi:hypothetical protein J7L48_09890 [bacterium]|nr:hypothetical protein [bacterium]
MNREFFEGIASFILKNVQGDHCRVYIAQNDNKLSRFADNNIHQSVDQDNFSINIELTMGKKHGTISTNRYDEENLRKLIAILHGSVKNLKDDDKWVIPKKGASFAYNKNFNNELAAYNEKNSADIIGKIFSKGKSYNTNISGSLNMKANRIFLANSYGNRGFVENTFFNLIIIPERDDNTTYNKFTGYSLDDFDLENFLEKPLKRLEHYDHFREIGKGKYKVLLEEFSAGNIFTNLSYMAFDSQAFAEKRSYLSDKMDDRVVGENITLFDDYSNGLTMGSNFDFELQERKKLTLFEKGIFRNMPMDTKGAKITGLPITGHSLWGFNSALPMNMVLEKGNNSFEQMLGNIEQGLLITRFNYTNTLDRKKTLFTGMTRNGVFIIENGRIVGTGNNLRFTIDIMETLNNVEMLGNIQHYYSNGWFGGIVIPELVIDDFNFTGTTGF